MKRLFLVLCIAVTGGALMVRAADSTSVGRELVKRYADAVVGVELVVTIKVKVGDREMPPREQKVEINGTVISADGLTVTSLAEVDPQMAFEAMSGSQRGGQRPELLGADFKEVKLRLADGTELPARFVLKDQDLDLAFMAPVAEEAAEAGARKTFAYVDLAQAAEGELLESYTLVGRAPKALQRVPVARTTKIMGVVEKPRRLYLMTETSLGVPMFDAAGRVLGITFQHFANSRRTGFVVLPAEDIAEIAKQAQAAAAVPVSP